MNITKINLVSVPVSDQDRALAFYVDTLGLQLVGDTLLDDEMRGEPMRWVQVAPKGAQTALTLVTWFPTMPAGSLKGLALKTSDVDQDTDRLRAAGVIVTDPVDQPWGRFVTFDDPDGNGIVLISPPAHR